jgi:hypothetical protein
MAASLPFEQLSFTQHSHVNFHPMTLKHTCAYSYHAQVLTSSTIGNAICQAICYSHGANVLLLACLKLHIRVTPKMQSQCTRCSCTATITLKRWCCSTWCLPRTGSNSVHAVLHARLLLKQRE